MYSGWRGDHCHLSEEIDCTDGIDNDGGILNSPINFKLFTF